MKYQFDGFLVDSATRQLFAAATEIHLSPKAFELLLLLIEQRSRALSKSQLQEHLWPSTFVGETNLPTLVAEIRRALGDAAQDSRYVRTVHRFGYRFVALVIEGAEGAPGTDSDTRPYLSFGERRFLLAEGSVVIGRAPDAAVHIDAAGVSRLHARVVVCGREISVEDLGSKNGTFVDGHAVTARRVLRDGDELRVGPVALTLRVPGPGHPTQTMM